MGTTSHGGPTRRSSKVKFRRMGFVDFHCIFGGLCLTALSVPVSGVSGRAHTLIPYFYHFLFERVG